MPDRWRAEEKDDGTVEVTKNGAWYSDADDLHDARGIASSQKAKEIEVVEKDGYRRTVRL